jgi:hypothetical protein
MFDVVGLPESIIKKAATVMVDRLEKTPVRYNLYMHYYERERVKQDDGTTRMQQVRHDGVVDWNPAINPCLDLRNALHCVCYNCSNFNLNTKAFCRLKARAAQEFIKRGLWPKMIERYLYGDRPAE